MRTILLRPCFLPLLGLASLRSHNSDPGTRLPRPNLTRRLTNEISIRSPSDDLIHSSCTAASRGLATQARENGPPAEQPDTRVRYPASRESSGRTRCRTCCCCCRSPRNGRRGFGQAKNGDMDACATRRRSDRH